MPALAFEAVDVSTLALCAAAGVGLGAIYFGGLWWTVRLLAAGKASAVGLAASWLLRLAILLGGMFALAHGEWTRIVAVLTGVILARQIALVLARRPAATRPGAAVPQASNAHAAESRPDHSR